MEKIKDQAGRLYKAEELSGIKYGDSMTLKECQKFVDKVLARKYVQANYRTLKVTVLDGRGRRSACATFFHGGRAIKLPKWSRNKFVILHEIAHHLTHLDGHRPAFASCHLDLVRHFMGKESADALQAAYFYKGVKVLGKNKPVKARCPQSRKAWVEERRRIDAELKEKLAKVA